MKKTFKQYYWIFFIYLFFLGILISCSCGKDLSTQPWTGGLVGVWFPTDGKPITKVMVLHQGHSCFACDDLSLMEHVKAFQKEGYLVYGFEMPVLPHDVGPIERFYQPVLDLVKNIPKSLKIYMVGFSGGGWTTTMVTSLEPRIKRAYSVAGDVPDEIRYYYHPNTTYKPDYEQKNMFSKEILSQLSDRLMHVYSYYDSGSLGGYSGDLGYDYVIDFSTKEHKFVPGILEYIIKDLKKYE